MMTWLNYITLNSVAPVPNLHEISDAGAGEGLMQLHPTRDTELIACGRANTLLAGEYLPSPALGNGSVTPAILVHGIFKALQKKGFKIRLHSYQLGLDNVPDFSDSELDDVVIHQCKLGEEENLIRNELIPELMRQAENGEEHLIAESGIGGTTFATLWLRHWLDEKLWFAGSTKDPEKLAVKSRVLEMLQQQAGGLGLDAEKFTRDMNLSDPVQRACCTLLAADLPSLHLAGGAMIFAPVIAMKGKTQVEKLAVGTTRWVLESSDAKVTAQALPDNCALFMPKTDFTRSEFDAIRMYERGYVIEGCGLGACLVFAEHHGLTQTEIMTSLDLSVESWLA
ncbi:hypothetical protein L3Q72_17360 [Vibrio sp. JC009]|uniref:hypothetical protein n=1 Tax=Vibrio sp. JC009 TaxID=2912314 RepID=UPI0023AF7441|nr:hypothetical protein [Vibrio sp. JC009]WED24643.1 hypothetical protein L3Q72_17360 [Vibrio sp. JC009]